MNEIENNFFKKNKKKEGSVDGLIVVNTILKK
jgi:hypothetical protein